MKKRFALLLAASLILGSLAGCGRFATTAATDPSTGDGATSGSADGQEVTINVYNWDSTLPRAMKARSTSLPNLKRPIPTSM